LTREILRLRVFAGPNGSGKSTIINAVKDHKVKSIPVDFGIYINADDLLQYLNKGKVYFERFELKVTKEEFVNVAESSGLINESFNLKDFLVSFKLENNCICLLQPKVGDRLAQILADFLRKRLLSEKKKFSFETVFSHQSKLEIMRAAKEQGYKVYLYFVSTEDPEINKYRVKKVRVAEGGHDVPEDKIESRYYRSLGLMYDAAQIAYQTYFFDNSRDGEDFKQFAHFKLIKGKKEWDKIDSDSVPRWFIKYYSSKI